MKQDSIIIEETEYTVEEFKEYMKARRRHWWQFHRPKTIKEWKKK